MIGLFALASAGEAQEDVGSDDLRDLLVPGFILQDRNDDGHPDFVDLRIVLPVGHGLAEIAAAANLAARISFESYATDLDLTELDGPEVGADGTPSLVVGRATAALTAAGVEPGDVLGGLAPGEGIVLRLPATADFPGGGFWVDGADATGLLAAASYWAARYPGVWDPEGPDYAEVARRLTQFLEEGEVVAEDVTLESAVVSRERVGVSRVRAVVRVATDEAVEEAARLLTGTASDPESPDPESDDPQPASILVEGLHRLDVEVVGPEGATSLRRIRPAQPWSLAEEDSWTPGDVEDFSLSRLYTTEGIFRDTRQDLVPDRTEAFISLHGVDEAAGAVNLAQRIGLETAGIRLPLVRVAGEEDRPQEHGFPILFGVDHFATRGLQEEGLLDVATGAEGEGFVEFVPEGLDGSHALVVGGTDAPGLEAAAELVARRFPYLTGNRKGEYRLSDAETEVRRFFQARNVGGQTALALVKLEEWLERLAQGERPGIPSSLAAGPEEEGLGGAAADPEPLERIELELNLDSIPDGLEAYVEERVRSVLPEVEASVALHPTGFGAALPVFQDEVELEWEVEEVRRVLREEGYPELAGDDDVRVEIRVSEPPEIREALKEEVRAELEERGIPSSRIQVQVLNAYKQGYSWVMDGLLSRLQELDPARIEIEYRHLQDSHQVPWQIVGSDTRWLQELFPVDAVLERELGIPDSMVVFHARTDPASTYRLRALDAQGDLLLEETFEPRYVIRPYFDLHPDYERVRVTTGWVTVESGGSTVVDRRVATDVERFWDFWQASALPRLRDYLLDLQEGDPVPDNAPYFDELRVDLRLSEPNHRIGIDEEVISSLESVHNELYFHTLAFLGHLGQHYGRGALNFAGRILPHVDPTGDGEPGWARVSLTGRERAAPELILRSYPGRGGSGQEGRWRYELSPLPTDPPVLRGAAVEAGNEGIRRLLFQVTARDSVGRYLEHRDRASEEAVDRAFLPVELLAGMMDSARELHDRGILGEALSFGAVDELRFRFQVERADEFRRVVSLPSSGEPLETRNPVLASPGFEHPGESIVQWETPIPPAENDSILARLAEFPEIQVYFAGRSFLGKNVFALDLLPPVEAELRSQAKMNALRPTAFFSGRQHANEVSSTSHILRLAELLATDPEYRELLQRVNVVLHPVANPDGAQLAYEMQLTNPDFTLHPGYLGALGVDMTAGAGSDDPIYPESQVRPEIMSTWLPDIYINMHGYPSHEWVQMFSGYAAWVRGRTVTSRTWWAPRGWFIPGFNWVDDPEHPEITTAQFAVLDTLAAAITGHPEVQDMNWRQYARYAKYGRQDVDGFREHFHDGMLIYKALRGSEASGSGPQNPRINWFSATTEAPDETARGDWLELVATAGLLHSSALLRYLHTGVNRVERETETFQEGVLRRVFRERPVLPPKEEGAGSP